MVLLSLRLTYHVVIDAGEKGEEEDWFRQSRVIDPSMCYICLVHEKDCDTF